MGVEYDNKEKTEKNSWELACRLGWQIDRRRWPIPIFDIGNPHFLAQYIRVTSIDDENKIVFVLVDPVGAASS